MPTYAKLNGAYVGNQPGTKKVYHDLNRPGAPGPWEEITIKKRGQWYDVDFTGDGRVDPLALDEATREPVVRADHEGWGGQWNLADDRKSLWIGDGRGVVRLELEGYSSGTGPIGPGSIHLEQRGNDFVDEQGNRTVIPAIDGFDDLWFATQNKGAELNSLMVECQQVKMKARRIWCMGDAGENQVFSFYPQNTPRYIDIARQLVAYENSFGLIPMFNAFVDAQRVMPVQSQRQAFWRDLNEGLRGSGIYVMVGGNQWRKNGFNPWDDLSDPGPGIIWSRGSNLEDQETGPRGATASELHATRNSFARALMDATASPPTMRGPASTRDGYPIGGSGMVWMTEGNPFGDGNGYSEEQARKLGCAYSIEWALAVHHNRQSQRGQLMHDDTARTALAWSDGMMKGMLIR